METVTVQARLRAAIDQHEHRLRAVIPSDRQAAILALLRARDRLPRSPGREAMPDLVTGNRLADLGGNKALQLCLEAADDGGVGALASSDAGLDGWAEHFLQVCGQLSEADL